MKRWIVNGHVVTEREQISEKVITIDIDGNEDLVFFTVIGTFYGQENVNLVKETFPNAIITEDYPGRYHVASNNK